MSELLPSRRGLRLRIHRGSAGCVLTLEGELDIAQTRVLETAVQKACRQGCLPITLDLSGLSFIDAAGLGAILRSREAGVAHGCGLSALPGEGPARRLLELTGTLELLAPTAARAPATQDDRQPLREAA